MMHENLQVIQTMLRSIHQMLGDRYEVILHDLVMWKAPLSE